jgi:hypothetical protein
LNTDKERKEGKERWKDGKMERWKDGKMERWKDGMLECWNVGMLERWNVGMLECWKVGKLGKLGVILVEALFDIFSRLWVCWWLLVSQVPSGLE